MEVGVGIFETIPAVWPEMIFARCTGADGGEAVVVSWRQDGRWKSFGASCDGDEWLLWEVLTAASPRAEEVASTGNWGDGTDTGKWETD